MPRVDAAADQYLFDAECQALNMKRPSTGLGRSTQRLSTGTLSLPKGEAWGKRALIAGAAAPLLMLVSACATAHPDSSFPAQKALLGKTESEVLACAGEPKEKSTSGDETKLTYHRAAPVFEESFAISKTSVPCPRHACEAIVILKGDRVSEVRYNPVPYSLGGCEHCEEIFRKCMP